MADVRPPAGAPRAAGPSAPAHPRAAAVRRWATALGLALALAVGWGLWGLATGGSRDWAGVTLPASLLLLTRTMFLTHRPRARRICAVASVGLLVLTLALPLLGGAGGGAPPPAGRTPAR